MLRSVLLALVLVLHAGSAFVLWGGADGGRGSPPAQLFAVMVLLLPRMSWAAIRTPQLQDVHYQSWLEVLDSSSAFVKWDEHNQSTLLRKASNSDDLSESLLLPFGFPFLGVERFEAFVGANGYVQFDSSNSPPCITNYYQNNAPGAPICFRSTFTYNGQSYNNDFNTTYFGLIAAFTTDLYPPYNYPKSHISWSAENSTSNASAIDTAYFHFHELPFYNFSMPLVNNTFHVRLRSDGGVTLFYEKVNFAACLAQPRACDAVFVVGIRNSSSKSTAPAYFTQSDAQLRAQNRWRTTVKGVYPPSIALIKSQTLFHLCPFSDSWCMSPQYVAASSSATRLNVTALSLSCPDKFASYECVFTVVALGSSTVTSVVATLVPGTTTFQCSVPATVLATAGTVSVDVRGVVMGLTAGSTFVAGDSTDAQLVLAPVSSLSVSLLSALLTLTVTQLAPSTLQLQSCAASGAAAVTTAGGAAAICGSCAGCGGAVGRTCLQSIIPCGSVASLSMCDGTCHGAQTGKGGLSAIITYQSIYYSTYVGGIQAACCPANLLDCAGECKGTKVIAPRFTKDELKENSNVCCKGTLDCEGRCGHTNAPQLDCANVCGGTAKVDACGVCSGGSTGIKPSACDLIVVFTDSLLNSSIPYVDAANWVVNKSGIAFRNITLRNKHSFPLSVDIGLPPDAQTDPVVRYKLSSKRSASLSLAADRVFVLAANSTYNFRVSISLERVFRARATRWAQKSITLAYEIPSATVRTKSKKVLPLAIVVPNCVDIPSRAVCMAVPMCMWCESSSPPVGLHPKPGDGVSRRLFNLISPPAVEPSFETVGNAGFCSSGYDQLTACTPYISTTDDVFTAAGARYLAVYTAPFVLLLLPVAGILYLTTLSPWANLF